MRISTRTIVSLLLASQILASCSVYDFWNGVYSDRAAIREFDRKEAAFYAKETLQQKELRKKIEIPVGNWQADQKIVFMKKDGRMDILMKKYFVHA